MSLSLSISELESSTPLSITVLLLISALTFVTALSWNNLVESAIDKYVEDQNTVKGHLIYATITTVLLFSAVYLFTQRFAVLNKS